MDGRAYTALYRSIASNQEAYHDESYSTWSYSGDTLFFNSSTGILGNPVLFSDPFPISDVVGLHPIPSEAHPVPFSPRHKPLQSVYNWDVDAERYGSLTGLPAFYGRVADREADLREHSVLHTRYTGILGDANWGHIHKPSGSYVGVNQQVPLLNADPALKYDWVSVDTINDNGNAVYSPHQVSRTGDITTIFDTYALAMRDAEDLVVYRLLPGANIFQSGCGIIYYDIANNSHKIGNNYVIDISYVYRIWRSTPDNWAEWNVHIRFDCGFGRTSIASNGFSDMLSPQTDTFWLTDYSSTVAGNGTPSDWTDDPRINIGGGWKVGDRFTVPALNTNFARPIYQVDETFKQNFKLYHVAWGGDRLAAVRRRVDSVMRDIRPSSFLAASDALDKSVLLLKSNNLQNLQHLKDITGILPSLEPFAEVLAKCARGDVAALAALVGLLAEEILKQRFERDPLARDTKELVTAEIEKKLGPLLKSQYRTLQGSFTYEFSRGENFVGPGRLVLVTRAKVRSYFDVGTLMSAMLLANSVGLLPSLARLWSLVPFSFVVDWFANIGKRLHAVDNQLLYMALGISWSLWSYKVLYYPTEAELSEFSLTSYDPHDPFCISVYQREFSHWAPKLSESAFDFLRPTHSPDPVTVAALAFVLI
jgi:hypothetical protein